MTAPAERPNSPYPVAHSAALVAGNRIAPSWPLDQLIAVNPWWEMRDQTITDVAARLTLLGHADGHMPRHWFKAQFPDRISPEHLDTALRSTQTNLDHEALMAWLGSDDQPPCWKNFSDSVDANRDLTRNVSWHEEIIHQISQFCASFYSIATPLPHEPDHCLYEAWLENVRNDRGIEIMMGEKGLHQYFDALPATAEALLDEAVADLQVPEGAMEDYFHALLLDINGWASWLAYLRWQSKLAGGSDDAMHQLLAIRLAWELVLWKHQSSKQSGHTAALTQSWTQQFARLPDLLQRHRQHQEPAWIWQRAAEVAFQQATHAKLLSPAATKPEPAQRPTLQAAFCIDVRSEIYRRALERQDHLIQTLGFAGFFGLPIEYAPTGASYTRPQLPGLLAPALSVTESKEPKANNQLSAGLNRRARWSAIGKAAPAAFGYVESVGLGYAFKLLRESLFGADSTHPVNTLQAGDPQYIISNEDAALDVPAQAELVAGILGAMTLTDNFASIVILAGHGSSTRNNPHAAGLDCGACGGQTGEINVRVLTQLLNDADVRTALAAAHGIQIPKDTSFVAALHDTTTDELHYLTALPAGSDLVQSWISAAGKAARRERAKKLGVDDKNTDKAIMERSRDWSQVRPEWGLAGNACFVVAPRSRTAHLDFAGRCFLHDYDEAADGAKGYPVLELIMTAPMLVTHWINMQYNTSVMDNELYGSGNKVLHNVVGGNIGVFEGNGGDLRIGLPMQSLHNGQQWMHDALRLNVYIAAPQKAIADIVDRHEVVQQLVDNDWLYLYRIDDTQKEIQRLYKGNWSIAS
ncbi:DUF2309 domain-containing protein [Congregibacter variabilis]|uniref:Probable inorganic carbon transporter subunit DabA n=1 Tax=Congregibacter variabilis TaxID=3081200 RepID=A0ABZ0I6Q9_9GAMM|nr:DUF2309 domain-containing protein [Congregibacter sp. IMCC43200]